MRRQPRRLVALFGVLAVVGSLIGTVGAATAASDKGPVTKLRHIDGLRAAASAPGATMVGDASFDIEWYQSHQIRKQKPVGGQDVRSGEAAAPVSQVTTSVSISGGVAGWEGSNHFDSRYSGGGNQFSGEPPDQGLCVSNDRVFEIVNSVVQVYDTSGSALLDGTPYFAGTEPVGLTLNEFFGQPPEFIRPSGPFGPFTFDVVCKFDPSVNRWFVTAEYLAQDPTTGDFTGEGGVFISVSDGGDPLGGWTVWDLNTVNNGTGGTPDHACSSGFCFGDYPQFGLDGNGLYLTTNEFDLMGAGEFRGTQLYAFSKADLLAGDAEPTMVFIEDVYSVGVDYAAYTVQPVDSLPRDRVTSDGGTMYFAMSHSAFVDGNASAMSMYRLTNTSSLNADTPSLDLQEAVVGTQEYSAPASALQKAGPTPFLACVNRRSCIGAAFPRQKGPIPLDAGGAGKVYGAWLRRGVVYTTTGTNLAGPGSAFFNGTTGKWKPIDVHTGVAYAAFRPSSGATFSATVEFQGYIDVAGQNITYPSVAMNRAGEGAIGVTLVGPDYHPSAAYVRFDATGPTGPVVVSGLGAGPSDGFSGTAIGGYRSRWGDYGAAAVAPNGTVWLASEYVNQSCTSAEFNADTTCGFTRTFYANWSTHITGLSL